MRLTALRVKCSWEFMENGAFLNDLSAENIFINFIPWTAFVRPRLSDWAQKQKGFI
jgi:hypothetical protein